MGNSLEQHRAAIGLFNARSRTKREAPDCPFWANIKDLLVIVAVLQLLIAGILAKVTKKSPDWSSPVPPLKSKSYLSARLALPLILLGIRSSSIRGRASLALR